MKLITLTRVIATSLGWIAVAALSGCSRDTTDTPEAPASAAPVKSATAGKVEFTDEQVDNLVRRSYQYVAMYNVNNKFAQSLGGWNTCKADTVLKDHTMRDIARPNNDTLYIACMLDLHDDAVILDIPAIDSKYVSLMVTAYDHYVNIPLASRTGDFRQAVKLLLYSARTRRYDGEPVAGIDQIFETSGDFVSAVFRVMPHASDPPRFARIVEQMQAVRAGTLAKFLGEQASPTEALTFPATGASDADVFGTNLLEVMQFVFNHTTFHQDNDLDQALLAAYEPFGVVPGRIYDPERVARIDTARLRDAAERVAAANLAKATDPAFAAENTSGLFQPKGKTNLTRLLFQSVIGPIGQPAAEAVYPAIGTSDGAPMNAMHDYVIRMTRDELPPANAFWSLTLYDLDQGFFIPNDRKKYSVGENGGMELDGDGGIAIYVAAEKPEGVPDANWLPIERKDLGLSLILRIYVPDLEAMKAWKLPVAEKL